MNRRKREKGQSLLETAIVLLLLVMLLYGVVEVGFGLRNYLLVSNANREAARFAARGRFNNEQIADRHVSSGGVERAGSQDVPFLRTEVVTPATASRNTGIIITTIVMDDEGNFDNDDVTRYAEGVFSCGSCDGVPSAHIVDAKLGLRILPEAEYADYSLVDLADIRATHSDITDQINDDREITFDLPRLDNQIIIVETFFIHRPWGRGLLPDPWVMYVHTEMRVATGR